MAISAVQASLSERVGLHRTFTLDTSSLGSGVTKTISLSQADLIKFGRFNSFICTNLSGQNLEVILNGNTDDIFTVPAGKIRVEEELSFNDIRIKNPTGSNMDTAGTLEIFIRKECCGGR